MDLVKRYVQPNDRINEYGITKNWRKWEEAERKEDIQSNDRINEDKGIITRGIKLKEAEGGLTIRLTCHDSNINTHQC